MNVLTLGALQPCEHAWRDRPHLQNPVTLRLHVPGRGSFVFPLMLLYTVIGYSVFGGKVRPTTGHY